MLFEFIRKLNEGRSEVVRTAQKRDTRPATANPEVTKYLAPIMTLKVTALSVFKANLGVSRSVSVIFWKEIYARPAAIVNEDGVPLMGVKLASKRASAVATGR